MKESKGMKKLKYIFLTLGLISSLSLVSLSMHTVAAVAVNDVCSVNTDSAICKKGSVTVPGFIKILVNTLLFILGVVAVIVIIIAGIFYATSSGNPNQVTQAKNTLLYAVVGLIVATLAYAIVNFVITSIK